ncbi:MAG: tRNA adenosine(34) deaminase TadA [Ruminococcus sp.]|nr:tRNA adenosine(34) deaminase TadA [Ruminococcus sp.]
MERYMKRALELAGEAFREGEVPVGAVIVKKSTGEIIGEGRNMREGAKNALAHAEIIAIDSACRKLGGWRLPDCAIYVTLEPCPMCCGAIINARIDDVIFGAYDLKSGSAVSVQKMFSLPYNYRPEVTGGVMEEECAEMLSDFFRQLREKKKQVRNTLPDDKELRPTEE